MKTITISMDAYLDMLQNRFDTCPEDWHGVAKDALFQQLLEMIEDDGVYLDNADPAFVVDNYLINGEFVEREEWEKTYPEMYKRYDGDWDEFCNDETILHNDDYACIQF